MFKKILTFANKHAGTTAGIIFITMLLVCYGFSWIVTCGLIKLITMCFGWTFSWGTATGIWLVMCIAKSIFSHNVTVKK